MGDLIGVAPELMGSVSFGGLRAYGLGYAVEPDMEGTIYLSLVGYRTAVLSIFFRDDTDIASAVEDLAVLFRTCELGMTVWVSGFPYVHAFSAPRGEIRSPIV